MRCFNSALIQPALQEAIFIYYLNSSGFFTVNFVRIDISFHGVQLPLVISIAVYSSEGT